MVDWGGVGDGSVSFEPPRETADASPVPDVSSVWAIAAGGPPRRRSTPLRPSPTPRRPRWASPPLWGRRRGRGGAPSIPRLLLPPSALLLRRRRSPPALRRGRRPLLRRRHPPAAVCHRWGSPVPLTGAVPSRGMGRGWGLSLRLGRKPGRRPRRGRLGFPRVVLVAVASTRRRRCPPSTPRAAPHRCPNPRSPPRRRGPVDGHRTHLHRHPRRRLVLTRRPPREGPPRLGIKRGLRRRRGRRWGAGGPPPRTRAPARACACGPSPWMVSALTGCDLVLRNANLARHQSPLYDFVVLVGDGLVSVLRCGKDNKGEAAAGSSVAAALDFGAEGAVGRVL